MLSICVGIRIFLSAFAITASFRTLALAVGREGKLTATTESQELIENFINPVISELGNYGHASIDYSQRKKQSTRMIKVECNNWGILFRARRTVADQCYCCPVCGEGDCLTFG